MKMVDHQWNLFLSFTFWIAFALEMLSHLIAHRVKVPTKHIFMSTIINVGIPLSGQDREFNSIRICFGAEGCTLRFFLFRTVHPASRVQVISGLYDGEEVTVYAHQGSGGYGMMLGIILVFSLTMPGAVLSR
jgi:hypothetical protein